MRIAGARRGVGGAGGGELGWFKEDIWFNVLLLNVHIRRAARRRGNLGLTRDNRIAPKYHRVTPIISFLCKLQARGLASAARAEAAASSLESRAAAARSAELQGRIEAMAAQEVP